MPGPFEQVGEQIVAAVAAGLSELAGEIMEQSLVEVPKDTLTLMRSARVQQPELRADSVKVVFGYGFGDETNPETRQPASEYVVPVHERTEVRHAPPTKAKYLEDPVFGQASTLGPVLAAKIRIALSAGGRMRPIN